MKSNLITNILLIIAIAWIIWFTLRAPQELSHPDLSEIDSLLTELHHEQDSIRQLLEAWKQPDIEEINNHYTTIIEHHAEIIQNHSVSADIAYFQAWQHTEH